MTDAELRKIADDVRRFGVEGAVWSDLAELAAYVSRYTDPTPLAECLERIAGERGGESGLHNGMVVSKFSLGEFTELIVWRGCAALATKPVSVVVGLPVNPPRTAGELHRLLDAMGVAK